MQVTNVKPRKGIIKIERKCNLWFNRIITKQGEKILQLAQILKQPTEKHRKQKIEKIQARITTHLLVDKDKENTGNALKSLVDRGHNGRHGVLHRSDG